MVVRTSVEENKENETVTQNICDEREKESRGGGERDRKRRFNTNTIQQLSVGQPPTVAE